MKKGKEDRKHYQPVTNPQEPLFDAGESWEDEWKGMPEFEQNKQEEYACLIVRFSNAEDLEDFSRLIGQNINRKTKSIWHPKLNLTARFYNGGKRYVHKP